MATFPTPPKTMVVLTSKFPSAQFMALGMKEQAEKRGVKVLLYLEYESGNRDFGAIAARVKEANPDFLWVGSLGLESNQLLEALRKLDYSPKNTSISIRRRARWRCRRTATRRCARPSSSPTSRSCRGRA